MSIKKVLVSLLIFLALIVIVPLGLIAVALNQASKIVIKGSSNYRGMPTSFYTGSSKLANFSIPKEMYDFGRKLWK